MAMTYKLMENHHVDDVIDLRLDPSKHAKSIIEYYTKKYGHFAKITFDTAFIHNGVIYVFIFNLDIIDKRTWNLKKLTDDIQYRYIVRTDLTCRDILGGVEGVCDELEINL